MASAATSGVFKIGGEMPDSPARLRRDADHRRGIWGEPRRPRRRRLRTLRRLPELGVDFIDTADSYGPNVSEELIREALHPYGGMLVATKAGLTRTGPDQWIPHGRPEYLIQQAHASRRRLGVETDRSVAAASHRFRRCRATSSSRRSSR